MAESRDPAGDLRTIAYLLERAREPTYRVRAFRTAAGVVADLPADEVAERAEAGTLEKLTGIGKVTALCITESLRGEVPVYLRRLEDTKDEPLDEASAAIRAALRGDCHTHSDWSDGGSPIKEMADTARALGHDYVVLTDHSPRLTVANGLSAERLERQLDVVAELNDGYASDGGPPFRILTGIEVDILDDGTLDQKPSLLARLDLVVASVHSKLRMPAKDMTPRMVAAIANPHTDVLGHCTGRLVTGGRGNAARVGVRRGDRVRGVRAVRRRGRDQLPAGAARPAEAAAAAGRRGRLPHVDRHRRPRARAARLAAQRLRARGPLRRADRDRRQLVGAGRPARLDRRPRGAAGMIVRADRVGIAPLQPGVESWHCFSAGPHYDPANVAFGSLVGCGRASASSPEPASTGTRTAAW